MGSSRQVRKNPAPPAKKRRKAKDSCALPAPPNRIRELRTRARMSLQDLSDLTGEPLPTLSRWETKGGVTLEKLSKVACALALAPVELVQSTVPKRLTNEEAFLLERFTNASPDVRAVITRIVQALTDL